MINFSKRGFDSLKGLFRDSDGIFGNSCTASATTLFTNFPTVNYKPFPAPANNLVKASVTSDLNLSNLASWEICCDRSGYWKL